MRGTVLTLATVLVTNALVGAIGSPPATAEPTATATVDGVDYPLCVVEDCSDQPGQIGIWTNGDGEQWLSLGESSIHITRDR